jgi:hypothetical protein
MVAIVDEFIEHGFWYTVAFQDHKTLDFSHLAGPYITNP